MPALEEAVVVFFLNDCLEIGIQIYRKLFCQWFVDC
jgi:hypothetical protein